MDLNIYYNNKVLSAQEREGFRIIISIYNQLLLNILRVISQKYGHNL